MSKIWEYESKGDDKLSQKVKKNKNIVMTTPEMAKLLISRVNIEEGDEVMEPCFGTGSFYKNFPTNCKKHFCEINLGKNYLDFEGEVDYTISNPPFIPRKLFWSFHIKAMETTRKGIYWLINISSLNVFTPKRLEEMNDKGWYINSFFIVADKRWFGRYAFVEINKKKSSVFEFHRKSF